MFLLRLKSQTIEDYGDVISYLCSYGIDNGPFNFVGTIR